MDWNPLLPSLAQPFHPSRERDCADGSPKCVEDTLAEMYRRFDRLYSTCDHNAAFGITYIRVTEEIRKAVLDGFYEEPAFLWHEDRVFARMYFYSYDAWASGKREMVPPAWREAFDAGRDRNVNGVGNLLMSMNAHINRDFPFMLDALGLAKPDGSSRKPDHDRGNVVLNRLYGPVLKELSERFDPVVDDTDAKGFEGDDTTVFQILQGWREDVWRNAERLAAADTVGQRKVVADYIEEYALGTARQIRAATTISDSGPRDAHCAAYRRTHREKGGLVQASGKRARFGPAGRRVARPRRLPRQRPRLRGRRGPAAPRPAPGRLEAVDAGGGRVARGEDEAHTQGAPGRPAGEGQEAARAGAHHVALALGPGPHRLGEATPAPLPRRSRSGSMPQRSPTPASCSVIAQRSGRSSPSWSGAAPLSVIEPVLSPIARISATSSSLSTTSAGVAASSARLSSTGRAPGAGLLDERGRAAPHGGVGEVPLAGELHRREPVALRDRAHPLDALEPALDPARRAKAAVVGARELVAGGEVAVEEPAVVHDAGDHLHALALGRGEHQLARPRLERVEDDHRPVDHVAEALEAVDQVEGEAVGRTGRDADGAREPRVAQGGHALPHDGAGVAGAVGVVEEQQVEVLEPAALQLPLGGEAQVGGVAVGAAQAGVGEARIAARAVALAVVEVVAHRADRAEVLAGHALERAGQQAVGLARRRRCRP